MNDENSADAAAPAAVEETSPSRRVTRRGFIRTSAVSAAAFGIPYIIPDGVLAAPGRPGANDRIVYGHIGLGGQGISHVVPDAAALCDVDSDHLANAAKRVNGTPLLTKDYRYILDRKDIDAVTIGAPDHWHAIMMVQACQAGKDVYSEKPTCKTIQEGQAMINAADHYKRVVQIGAQGRSNPSAHVACEYIRNGQIGKVNRVEVWHENNWTDGWGAETDPPSTIDWDLWLGPAQWKPYNAQYVHFNFRWMMDFGAGFIRDRGNHVLSIVLWCMNQDKAAPVSVEATGEPAKDGVWDVPVTMEAKWEFKNPDWTLTWSQPGARYPFPGTTAPIPWGAKYYGDHDTLIVSGGDSGCDTEPKAKAYTPPANGVHVYQDNTVTSADPLERHRENWRHCMRTRNTAELMMPIDPAVHVITLPILANISYRLGRKLQWDPARQEFIGDEEANRYLAQPYRTPWKLG
ncbi:MAG TPA: Gfo/Idh/MocA family oxidoreductase [Armatimonadota bacterium]|nr:Gfo/Idh/MocA family oxidoreductase [Armatimonadota bacterium]